MHPKIASVILSLAVLASAGPIRPLASRDGLTADQIVTISPKSSSCDGAPAPEECATAAQAAPFISDSFQTYQVTSPAEQAALISLMAFETGDFKYNRNHFPGVTGQGTRNMQSPTFNQKYAASIPDIQGEAQSASGDVGKVLDLLLSDEKYDFGSAAWFLTSQCSADVRSALQSGSESGWESYISSCIGTTVTDDRKAYWTRAMQALGVASS